MKKVLSVLLVLFLSAGFVPEAGARPKKTEPEAYLELDGRALEQFIGLLNASDNKYSGAIKNFYMAVAERSVKDKALVSPRFWDWLSRKPDIREGLLAANFPVHPGTVENLEKIRRELGIATTDKYAHFALAVAVALKEKDFDAGAGRGSVDPEKLAEINEPADKVAAYLKSKNMTVVEFVKNADTVLGELDIHKKSRGILITAVCLKTGIYPKMEFPHAIEFMKYLIKHH